MPYHCEVCDKIIMAEDWYKHQMKHDKQGAFDEK